MLDVWTLEYEHDFRATEVDAMPNEAEVARIVRRPRKQNFGCSIVTTGFQLRRDDNSLHPSMIRLGRYCVGEATSPEA